MGCLFHHGAAPFLVFHPQMAYMAVLVTPQHPDCLCRRECTTSTTLTLLSQSPVLLCLHFISYDQVVWVLKFTVFRPYFGTSARPPPLHPQWLRPTLLGLASTAPPQRWILAARTTRVTPHHYPTSLSPKIDHFTPIRAPAQRAHP